MLKNCFSEISSLLYLPFFHILQDTITYELPESASENKAVDYFFVTPDTGVVHLKQSLQNDEDRETQYRVSVNNTDFKHRLQKKRRRRRSHDDVFFN